MMCKNVRHFKTQARGSGEAGGGAQSPRREAVISSAMSRLSRRSRRVRGHFALGLGGTHTQPLIVCT
jgi:hypothetical protein